ncbi:MAG: hypothetical protein H6508_09525 [Calditrichaeota bacterium]|nr:hypothetical protein [Calditrichota bacterium]
MKAFMIGICMLLCWATSFAQIQAGGTPRGLSPASSYLPAAPNVVMPLQDNSAFQAEDEGLPKDEQNRFAIQLPVNLNLSNSGIWTNAPDGGRVWRLRIESQTAYSLALLFDEWFLPKGAELFVYNDRADDVLGALTSFNNWVDGTNVIRHLKGDAITVELYEPANVMGESVLSISTVCHAYKNYFGRADALDNFGDSGSCNNNVICPEASAWQDEKRGVCMITSGGSRICSGSMIRANVANWPAYFLTANHCGFSSSWVFVFNYESPQCSPSSDGSTAQTVANATLRSNYSFSDFELLELSSHPPVGYNAFYNGWNRNDVPSTSSVCIHHPRGDVKKWTIDNNAPTTTSYNNPTSPGDGSHWRIAAWDDGTTEPGSSGSPLFDQNSRITGQLHGGQATCSNNINDYYGKFSVSWAGGGTNATRLSNWLDPNGTGATTLNGSYRVTSPNDECPGTFVTLPYVGSGSTTDATASGGACAWATTPDVWYYFYLDDSCAADITVSLCGSSYDTYLEVRFGGSCPGDMAIDCTDDDCGLQSSATFPNYGVGYYYVRVFGYNGATGNYTINISRTLLDTPPVNDNCSSPSVISTLPYTDQVVTCMASNDFSACVMGNSNDVIYRLNVAECQTITATTCLGYATFDTRLAVLTGGACPGTSEIACNDDFCGFQSQVQFDATAGVDYYIIVGGFGFHKGYCTLTVTGTPLGGPANDDCSGAPLINSLPYNDSGSTACANVDYPTAGCGSVGFESRDVVYRLNIPTCENVEISLCGSTYDTRIQVMSGGSCPGNTLVACNDDACNLQSQLTFGALANTDYYILVRGFTTSSFGDYDMTVQSVGSYVSPNDVCPGGIIATVPYVATGNTSCSNDDYANGDCYFPEASPEDVYTLTLGSTQGLAVSLCGSGYDTGLKVRRGGACPGDIMVVCDDDAACSGAGTLQSTVEFTAQAGVTYFIQVSGFSSNSGPYTIHVEPMALNPIDSLVIKEVSGAVQLWWEDNGGYYYTVFKSTSSENLYSIANIFANTSATTFTDVAALGDQYFYGVTYVPDYLVPVLLANGLGERPVQDVYRDAFAQLKIDALPVMPMDVYAGPISDSPELAGQRKADTASVPVHSFGPGLSIENPVPGKDYSAQ